MLKRKLFWILIKQNTLHEKKKKKKVITQNYLSNISGKERKLRGEPMRPRDIERTGSLVMQLVGQ